MGEIYYYCGSRNPKRGGLYMEQEESFPWKEAEKIRKNYLELMSLKDEEDCLAVFSLGEGKYAVSTAKKVQTPQERRPHPESRGILIEEEDLECLLYVLAGKKGVYELFAPDQAEELRRKLDQAEKYCRKPDQAERTSGKAKWSGMVANPEHSGSSPGIQERYEVTGAAGAVKEIACSARTERSRRIILKTDLMEKKMLLSELYRMVPVPYWRYMNVIANGECPTADANILIVANGVEVIHQETKRYRTMGWRDFVNFGNQSETKAALARLGEVPAEEEEQEDFPDEEEERIAELEELFRDYGVKDPLLKECLSMCEDYQSDYATSDYVISDIRNMLSGSGENMWNEWQYILRRVLMDKDWSDKDDRDMMLLMFAFEKYPGSGDAPGNVMRENPYDVPGMLNFIREKAGKKFGGKKLRTSYLRRLVKLLNHGYMMLPEEEDMEFVEQEVEKAMREAMQSL